MKKLLMGLCLISSLALSSCSEPDTSGGGSTPTTVPLSFDPFHGLCWKPGTVENVGYTIDVIVETLDNASGASSTFWDETFNKTGNESSTVNIEVPSTGTWQIIVNITATDCSECCFHAGSNCSGAIIYDGSGNPVARQAGYPRWYGIKNFVNQSAKPSSVHMTLKKKDCLCSCTTPW